jgi:hypothetical protein
MLCIRSFDENGVVILPSADNFVQWELLSLYLISAKHGSVNEINIR